jgi:hypothetical protein
MSGKNKNYNSIIFLTTLSVYLGLTLLGATPQVLAYAATTRDFDIKTEIEYKDDFDNKPDEESSESQAENFPRIFANFLTEVKRNSNEKIFERDFSGSFQSYSFVKQQVIFGVESNIASGPSESIHPFAVVSERFIYSSIFPTAIKVAEYKDLYNRGTNIGRSKEVTAQIKGDKDLLTFEVSFNKLKAEIFADYLKAKYVSLAKNTKETSLKKLYENTEIKTENDQVFIVIRLPRAGIDSLIR